MSSTALRPRSPFQHFILRTRLPLTGWSAQPGLDASQLAPAQTEQVFVWHLSASLNQWKRGMQVALTSGWSFSAPGRLAASWLFLPAPRRTVVGSFRKLKMDFSYPHDKCQMCFQERRFATPLMTAGDTLNLRASTARGVPAALAARICLTF
jgi:hypothetical protein